MIGWHVALGLGRKNGSQSNRKSHEELKKHGTPQQTPTCFGKPAKIPSLQQLRSICPVGTLPKCRRGFKGLAAADCPRHVPIASNMDPERVRAYLQVACAGLGFDIGEVWFTSNENGSSTVAQIGTLSLLFRVLSGPLCPFYCILLTQRLTKTALCCSSLAWRNKRCTFTISRSGRVVQ